MAETVTGLLTERADDDGRDGEQQADDQPKRADLRLERADQWQRGQRAGRLGATVHPKPFSPLHLMEAIEAALRTECVGVSPGATGTGGTSR